MFSAKNKDNYQRSSKEKGDEVEMKNTALNNSTMVSSFVEEELPQLYQGK